MENNNIKNCQAKNGIRRKDHTGRNSAAQKSKPACSFLLKPLSFFILLSLPGFVFAAETFNAEMLKNVGNGGDIQDVNLDYFAEKGGQMPGTYQVDIYLNNQQVDSRNVEFVSLPDAPGKLYGAITPAEMAEYGVKLDVFPDLKAVAPDAQLTKPLSAYVPLATENLDLNRKRYDITVPQIGVNLRPRNSVDPKRWDNGIAAFMLNYSYSGSTTQRDDSGQSKSNFVNLRSGANLGAWRLRNYSTYSDQYTEGTHGGDDTNTRDFESINTYVQRDVRFLQGGQLTLGEYSTPADVFDSVQFTGAQLASDDQMLPDSMSQFAPTVRGMAVVLLIGGVNNAMALGVCSYLSRQPLITVNMNVTSQQDWPNGFVIGGVAYSTAYKVAENCSGEYQMTKTMNTAVYPSSTSKIFKSGVEGVGIRLTIGGTPVSTGANQTSGNGDGSSPINLQDVDVELIKTGDIVPGSVTPGELATVEMKDSAGTRQVLTINIGSVNIKQASCEITGSSAIPVPMGDVMKEDFQGKNSTLKPQNINIPLQCSAQTRVNINFDAKSSQGNGIIDLTAGGAEGVGIQLKLNSTPVIFNKTLFVAQATEQGAFNIPLTAAYIQTADDIAPGSANAVANFTVTYE